MTCPKVAIFMMETLFQTWFVGSIPGSAGWW